MEKVILELKNTLDKSTIDDAEKMLRSFYRTIEPHEKRNWKDPLRISWEIYAEKDKIGFYVVVPKSQKNLIKNRIIDAYPQVEIKEIEQDYISNFDKPFTAKMELRKHHMFATKMKNDDGPLNSVLNSMSRLNEGDRMLLQISMVPINDKWQGKAYKKYRDMLFHGKKPNKYQPKKFLSKGLVFSVKGLFEVLGGIMGVFIDMGGGDKSQNTPIERDELKASKTKITLPAFNVAIRMAVESKGQGAANNNHTMSFRLSGLTNSFIEIDGDNEWRRITTVKNKVILDEMVARKVDKKTNDIVTTTELSPIIRVNNRNIYVPELTRRLMKTMPIPSGLDGKKDPFMAYGLYHSQEFELYNPTDHPDSLVHPWMISGAMGGGKTTLITGMMAARALKGYSVIILDTQGDMSNDFLGQLPKSEWDRVVWLNFGDLSNPIALDMLETIPISDPEHQKFVTDFARDELLGIFKKMFGQNFGPQTEYIISHIINSIMASGASSFISMYRMLVDDSYREEIASQIRFSEPFSWSFWRNFQDNFSEAQRMKMMMPSINKIGAFVRKRAVRNITSQGLGSQNYSFRKMMDEGKIVVVTIPKGKLIGTWDLIGRLIISKIWLATLSREDISDPNHRKPCFLAVDEAEDLIEGNENFDIMLSQSRKYRLGLVFGFQYLNQIKRSNRRVYDALIGNKPNIVAMKIGEQDADSYVDMFRGYYEKEDMDFPDLHGIAKLNVRGTYSTPFTIRVPYNWYTRDNQSRTISDEATAYMKERSRTLYARPIAEVEQLVDEQYNQILKNLTLDENAELDEHDSEEEVSEELLNKLRKA